VPSTLPQLPGFTERVSLSSKLACEVSTEEKVDLKQTPQGSQVEVPARPERI